MGDTNDKWVIGETTKEAVGQELTDDDMKDIDPDLSNIPHSLDSSIFISDIPHPLSSGMSQCTTDGDSCQGHSTPSVPSAKVAIVGIANYPGKG